MKRALSLAMCLSLLVCCSGCAAVESSELAAESTRATTQTVPLSTQAGPIDDPSVPRTDVNGRSPSDAVLELVATLNQGDWESAYFQYAAPYIDYDEAVKHWLERGEQYEDFMVLETRVERDDLAFLRVKYTISVNGSDGMRQRVTMDEPDDWWAVDKVDGRWETRWMPAQ